MQKHLCGLIHVEKLSLNDKSYGYDSKRSGFTSEQSGSGRGAVGGWSGTGRNGQNQVAQGFAADSVELMQNARLQPVTKQNPVVVVASV